MKRALLAITLAACGGTQHAAGPGSGSGSATTETPEPAMPGITPGLQPAAWLVGDWKAVEGAASLHWVAAAGALYGVQLDGNASEVTIIDDAGAEHVLTLWSYDAHGAGGPTTIGDSDPKGLRFTQANDAPAPIARTFTQTSDTAMISGGTWAMGQQLDTRAWTRGPAAASAPELEAADRAFEADTAKRGADGWTDWFAPDGVNWGGGRVITGRDAIHADIA
ncbi:MAG: hypothetical protein K8W52_06805, partial [Deltaproteobacteria bacterium]|nr:hypothetical protein [Deltaproteobacteria bacterium]